MTYPAQKTLVGILLLAVIVLYFFRLQSVSRLNIPENTVVTLKGRVTQQPYLKGSYQTISLGPISLITDRFPGYFYGDKLEVTGKFGKQVINQFQTRYYTSFPTIRLVKEKREESKKFNLIMILLNIRGRIEKVIGELLPEPQSSLLLGIIFGTKRQMPQEFWQNLRKTGTLHIVVVSGQNVTMLVKFLIASLVLIISRRKALVLAIIGVILYVLMVGAEAPVARAGIMGVLAYSAQVFGREREGMVTLLFAAGIMLLISPLILFDIGFQLSFAATTGILWFYPWLKKKKLFSIPLLGEGLATTLSAQIGVMPILLTNFGQMSFLSPLINALVLWVVPNVMVLGSILAFLALIVTPLAQLLSWFVWLLLTYFVKIIEVGGKLPWVSYEIGKLSAWWAIGYYLALILILISFEHKKRSPKIAEANGGEIAKEGEMKKDERS